MIIIILTSVTNVHGFWRHKTQEIGLYPMLAYTCYYYCDAIVLGPNWGNPRAYSQIHNSRSYITCAWYSGCPSSIGHCPLPLDLTVLPNKVMLSPKLLVFAPSLLSLVICLLPVIYALFQKWMMLLNIVIIIRVVAMAIWQWTCHISYCHSQITNNLNYLLHFIIFRLQIGHYPLFKKQFVNSILLTKGYPMHRINFGYVEHRTNLLSCMAFSGPPSFTVQ